MFENNTFVCIFKIRRQIVLKRLDIIFCITFLIRSLQQQNWQKVTTKYFPVPLFLLLVFANERLKWYSADSVPIWASQWAQSRAQWPTIELQFVEWMPRRHISQRPSAEKQTINANSTTIYSQSIFITFFTLDTCFVFHSNDLQLTQAFQL